MELWRPGSLVRVRDREWVVLPGSNEELLLVRPLGGTSAEETGILPALEPPAPTSFAPPTLEQNGHASSARLLHDALRFGFRSSAGPLRSFASLNFEPRAYQLVPLLMALRQDPVRLLIGDDVGIGKTVESLLIAKELMAQGSVERLAVLCPPHLAEQWQAEMSEKFHLDAELVLASTARRLERSLGPHESIFDRHPVVIVSSDFIKAPHRREDFARRCPEFVIVDEAHTFSAGTSATVQLRHQLLSKLASDPSRHMVLVTATPHSGKGDGFRSLLSLLDPALEQLPEDLSGDRNARHREALARHFIQRRRENITQSEGDQHEFPERLQREVAYKLSAEYTKLLADAIGYARDAARETYNDRRSRVHWWSALGLLRAIGSSPAAALATLTTRSEAAAIDDIDELDGIGRRSVFDEDGSGELAESQDVSPGALLESEPESSTPSPAITPLRAKSWFADLAAQASELQGDADPKLAALRKLLRRMVKEGSAPIVFCRFIATAEYLAEELAGTLGAATEIAAVTGRLAAPEREQRVHELAGSEKRVLIATDCLSEGINLQASFDAVVHYDLAWNPTRHEQREGRVDRFGQPKDDVRIATMFAENSPIDGMILEVLLRKHRKIREELGISIPVPGESGKAVDAILEGLLVRDLADDHRLIQLEMNLEGIEAASTLQGEWDLVAQREKSRAKYAQQAIRSEQAAAELALAREAAGSTDDVERFLEAVAHGAGGRAVLDSGRVLLNLSGVDPAIREAAGVTAADGTVVVEAAGGISRSHPAVQGLAGAVLDQALDAFEREPIAARCAAMLTSEVAGMTTLLLLRGRMHLELQRRGRPTSHLLAEEAVLAAFRGTPEQPEWLSANEARALLAVRPTSNIPEALRTRRLRAALDGVGDLDEALRGILSERAAALEASHNRLRAERRERAGSITVRADDAPDVLGVYVYLPGAP